MTEARPLRVLVADDNPVNQRLMRALLGKLGHEATTASNGLEALRALEASASTPGGAPEVDVVLLDVNMPVMDGIAAAGEICRLWARPARPFLIALTASVLDEDRERCEAAGMDGFVGKPFTLDELSAALACAPRRRYAAR
jgi:CheY-like chemotaxis protein